jgi:indolepyruvate ferredoxin oxidoreductase
MSYKIFNGNELLIEGGKEAGFDLYTGYPGSPLADFFNILYEQKEQLKQQGIKVVIANSEANAAAMASGAKMAGKNVLVGMKSMGLHVAADALSVGNFANPGINPKTNETSGVVIAVGDDPWSISTSTPADSRYLFKHLHIPFLEPSTPQELKNWMAKALELSQKSSVYTGVLLTTFLAEGGGRVEIDEENTNRVRSNDLMELNTSEFNLQKNVMVPPNSLFADIAMIRERFPKVLEVFKNLNLDQFNVIEKSEIAIISAGAVYESVKQVMQESGLDTQFSLYKCAGSFPLNEPTLVPFLRSHKKIVVIEEKRGFLESEIASLALKYNLSIDLFGKDFKFDNKVIEGFPAYGGLSVEMIYDKLIDFLNLIRWSNPDHICALKEHKSNEHFKLELNLASRLPTFCPGCPHRETLSLLKEIRKILKDQNVDLVSHGDVGCYSLSFLEPFKEMHDLSAMGQGGSLGAGADIFTKNPSVVLMGDSTFFHSGMNNISNSVQMGHNITYILLDNDNTAMTGHQMTPVSGVSVEGGARPRQSMIEIARAMQVDQVLEVNPSDRYFYLNLLLDLVQKPGVKVIISNKECGLTFHSREKKHERDLLQQHGSIPSKTFYQINTDACEDCRSCVEMTGCPGLSQTFDAYGSKVTIDPQICVSDSYCTKIKACPSFELVEVTDYNPPKLTMNNLQMLNLPEVAPKKSLEQIAKGDDFRCVVIGVGGSGVTTISRVLAEAALEMGGRSDLDFKFVDQKGLAQRNGSVTSHMSIFRKGYSRSQTNPVGTCDLVISPDLLEGARAVKYLKASGQLVIDEEFQVPLSILLDRAVEKNALTAFDIQTELEKKLKSQLVIGPFKSISHNKYQKSVYASAMLIGVCYQSGFLPFSSQNLIDAIKRAVPKKEINNNLAAFELGRLFVVDRSHSNFSLPKYSTPLFEQSIIDSASFFESKQRLSHLFKNELNKWSNTFTQISSEYLAQYLHDLIIYNRGADLNLIYNDLLKLKEMYSESQFPMVMSTYIKNCWIKDEVFVAHQLISPLKKARDHHQYAHLGQTYKVGHINRPSFDVLGKKIEFDMNPKDWMLKLMRHLRFMRAILPQWHKHEKQIAKLIHSELLTGVGEVRIRELSDIKGYREVRYAQAQKHLGYKYE